MSAGVLVGHECASLNKIYNLWSAIVTRSNVFWLLCAAQPRLLLGNELSNLDDACPSQCHLLLRVVLGLVGGIFHHLSELCLHELHLFVGTVVTVADRSD